MGPKARSAWKRWSAAIGQKAWVWPHSIQSKIIKWEVLKMIPSFLFQESVRQGQRHWQTINCQRWSCRKTNESEQLGHANALSDSDKSKSSMRLICQSTIWDVKRNQTIQNAPQRQKGQGEREEGQWWKKPLQMGQGNSCTTEKPRE